MKTCPALLTALTTACGIYAAGSAFAWGLADSFAQDITAMYAVLDPLRWGVVIGVLASYALALVGLHRSALVALRARLAKDPSRSAGSRRRWQAVTALGLAGFVLVTQQLLSGVAGLVFYAPMEAAVMVPASMGPGVHDAIASTGVLVCLLGALGLLTMEVVLDGRPTAAGAAPSPGSPSSHEEHP